MPKRTPTTVDAKRLSPERLNGLVVRSNRGGEWGVRAGDSEIACALPGRLKLADDGLGRLAVGDRVELRRLIDEPERGVIEAVLPRHNVIGRGRPGKRPQLIAANLHQLAVVVACAEPDLSLHTIDRYLVLAAAFDVPALLVLNKADLDPEREVIDRVRAIYEPLQVALLVTSAVTGDGIDAFRAALAGRISAVIGPSGAGKSSLLNAANPGYRLRTGEVMAIGKGRHTTTETTLLPLDDGGWVADTPGIKSIALVADRTEPSQLQHLFVEFAGLTESCRFANCTHRSEPGCAVESAVAGGRIAASRYDSYVRLYHELEAARRAW